MDRDNMKKGTDLYPTDTTMRTGVEEALGALLGWIGSHFEQEDGATAPRTASGLPYYTLRFAAAKGGPRIWELELIRTLKEVLEDLKFAGAVKIIWRTRPYLSDDESTYWIRARLVALNKDGEEVKTVHAVTEGESTPMIQVDENKLSEMPPLGYDFLGPREEAVILAAMVAHNVIKALNDANGEPTLSWQETRGSNMVGVMAVLNNPMITPEQSHESWMAFKKGDGWKLGPKKDPILKTHPLLVPYDMLPKHQQVKDVIFGAIVRTMFGI